jgi:hypothetical protein
MRNIATTVSQPRSNPGRLSRECFPRGILVRTVGEQPLLLCFPPQRPFSSAVLLLLVDVREIFAQTQ